MDYLSLCLICKDENDYLPEWLDYHILMGVDRFYIYDNESQVSLRESLKDYIERGWVVVTDIPGHKVQLYAYDHCLHTFGANTFWLGFIDTDEFLVPKTTLGLKDLLKGYEAYAGLAVSSLFFGSNGHVTRPAIGQIAAYTLRTHETFVENELVKSIVQPGLALMPNSPHDFTFKGNAWCVNESLQRVDGQRFPNKTELIQLNHYFCRSQAEIAKKLSRGGGVRLLAWPRERFDAMNSQATYQDVSILQNLAALFQAAQMAEPQPVGLLEKMSALAHTRRPMSIENIPVREEFASRAEFMDWENIKAQGESAKGRGDLKQACQILKRMSQMQPQNIVIYVDLAAQYLKINDPGAAWQALTQAWQLSPNNYIVLGAMVFYFLRSGNYSMAEKTCQLLLEMAPHNLTVMALLTEALLGQGRYEEAIEVGTPVVELSARIGELPERMSIFLVKKMADHLLEKKDYSGAVRLWEAGVKCMPRDVNAMIELSQVLLLAGDKTEARQRLAQAQALAPQNETVLALLRTDALSAKKAADSEKLPARLLRQRKHR
jgi:tetratricopeptide (TPR) repeat protein